MKNNEQNKKVYFAGPDVFESNAIELGKEYVEEAKKRDLIGLYPLDNIISNTVNNPSYEIFRLNKELLDSADYIVANLNDFRGYEPDSGTVWEIAYAFSKNKIVVGYISEKTSILDRIKRKENVKKEGVNYIDKEGKSIENFGHPLNIMLQHSLNYLIQGGVKEALDEVKKIVMNNKDIEDIETFKTVKTVKKLKM